MKNLIKKKQVILVILFIVQIVFILWSGKYNFHVDEFYTYGLANSTDDINPTLEDGKRYSNMGPYEEYLTVNKSGEGRFDYENVWKNQAADVHPPLYYVFIHTICSFFPGVFSKWFGIAFNVVCIGIINILAFLIGKKIFQKESMGLLFAGINGTMYITMNMVLFIRMYALMTVFTMAIILLFLHYKDCSKLKWSFWIQLYLYSVLGTLTQYYFLIFLFWACLFWGIRFIIKREWKNVCGFLLCLCMAGITCVGIFPAMIEQIFGSGFRGQQAFENARTMGNFIGNLKGYIDIIDNLIFGNVFVPVTIVCVIFLLLNLDRISLQLKKDWNNSLGLLLICAFGYIGIIAKIAPFITDRYIMPVSWILALLFMYLVYKISCICLQNKSQVRVFYAVIGIFGFMIIASYYLHNWKSTYSYAESKQQLDMAEQYKDNSVIYVYDESWKTMPNILELMKYKDYQFSKVENLDSILAQHHEENLVVYIISTLDNTKILQQILDNNEYLDKYEPIYSWYYANVYYLSQGE